MRRVVLLIILLIIMVVPTTVSSKKNDGDGMNKTTEHYQHIMATNTAHQEDSNNVQPSTELIQLILNSSNPYNNDIEMNTCKQLVNELTIEQQEIAARTSYAYWLYSTAIETANDGGDDDDNKEKNERDDNNLTRIRIEMAMREARRHLTGQRNNFGKALLQLKRTCEFRKERKVDLLRTAFKNSDETNNCTATYCSNSPHAEEDSDDTSDYNGEDDDYMQKIYRQYVSNELNTKQLMVARGLDKHGRAVAIKMNRTCLKADTDIEEYVMAQIYMIERTLASTEYYTAGQEENCVAIFDYKDYSSKYSPPISAMSEIASIFDQHYPERLHKAIILDAPFWMRSIYTLLKPLFAKETKEKITFATGDKQRIESISEVISNDQAMPFMLPNGKLTSSINVNHFTNNVPFNKVYDGDNQTMSSQGKTIE